MEQLLDGKEIVKSYGEGREKQLVLDHVSLEMERGGFVSVMGPSGSGKSTCAGPKWDLSFSSRPF